MKIQISLSAATTLYHVTLTEYVGKIKKQGLSAGKTSNWVRASNKERYGGGYIFAFTNIIDAIRWAAKMDWSVSTKLGSGKISIIKFTSDPKEWEVDVADPLTQSGAKGKWLKRQTAVPASSIKSSELVTSEFMKENFQKIRS